MSNYEAIKCVLVTQVREWRIFSVPGAPVSPPDPTHPPTLLAFMIITSWVFFIVVLPVYALLNSIISLFLFLHFIQICNHTSILLCFCCFHSTLYHSPTQLRAVRFPTYCCGVAFHCMHLLHVVYLLMVIWFTSSFWLLRFFGSHVHFFRSLCVSVCSGSRYRNGIACQRVCISSALPVKGQAVVQSRCHSLHPTRECPWLCVFASLWESDFESYWCDWWGVSTSGD